MGTYKNMTFTDTNIDLCNNTYTECRMERCQLVFDASGPIALVGNTMIDCQWVFDGAAKDTLHFLASIYSNDSDGSIKTLISNIFKDIQNGNMLKSFESRKN